MCTEPVTLGHAVVQGHVAVFVALATSVDEGDAGAGAGLVEEAGEGRAARTRLRAHQALVWGSEVKVSPDNETFCSVSSGPSVGRSLPLLSWRSIGIFLGCRADGDTVTIMGWRAESGPQQQPSTKRHSRGGCVSHTSYPREREVGST